MKGLITLVILVVVLVVGVGCRGYREYARANDQLGAQGLYSRWDYREFAMDSDRLGPRPFYHKAKLSYDLDKLNDDLGPKHVYYYE